MNNPPCRKADNSDIAALTAPILQPTLGAIHVHFAKPRALGRAVLGAVSQS
jgi:hypothetical protein